MEIEEAIEATGCKELNDKVLECYYEHKDWRKCTGIVQQFKECIAKSNKDKQHN